MKINSGRKARFKDQLTWDGVNSWTSTNEWKLNLAELCFRCKGRVTTDFSKSTRDKWARADFGPALRPNSLGQPFKIKGILKSGPYTQFKYLIAQTLHLIDNIKKIFYLLLLVFVSFEELFCFTKTIFVISQPLSIYVDIWNVFLDI